MICVFSHGASPQLVGRFSLKKDVYVVGEPIYLNFDLANTSSSTMSFITGNSYSGCGGYDIRLANDRQWGENSTCEGPPPPSCIMGGFSLKPGEVHHDKVLLNYEHDLSKPGITDVRASRVLNYAQSPRVALDPKAWRQVKTEGRFRIRLEDVGVKDLSTIFKPYLADLSSKSEEQRSEAGRAIGSAAPAFLEETIVAMASSLSEREFGLLGLRRLNTEKSRKVLAEIVERTPGYSSEKEKAIHYLSEMADRKYFRLLLNEANGQEPNVSRDYILAAARLGGEDAMPYVNSLLISPDAFLRANGVMALSETGSRRAVPLLVYLLQDSNVGIRRLASTGLVHLTHRRPSKRGDPASSDYDIWLHWWSVEGERATIYGPMECGPIEIIQ